MLLRTIRASRPSIVRSNRGARIEVEPDESDASCRPPIISASSMSCVYKLRRARIRPAIWTDRMSLVRPRRPESSSVASPVVMKSSGSGTVTLLPSKRDAKCLNLKSLTE